MKPRVALLLPTLGRPELENALRSIADQWDGERVVVLAQQNIDAAQETFDIVDPRIWFDGKPTWTFHALGDATGGWGHDSRNFALDHLVPEATHIGSLDDDDILLPGALEAFADAAFSDAPVSVFKTRWGANHPAHGVTLWRQEGLVSRGEIATPMIFWRKCWARYGVDYMGDYDLACALLDIYPKTDWAWRDECVCEVRPVAGEAA